MSRHSHAALLGLLLVGCQKEPLSNSREHANSTLAEIAGQDKPIEPSNDIPACAARNNRGTFVPVGESGNNTLALMRWYRQGNKKTLAIAADEDENALQIVDVETHAHLGTTKLSGKPARVLIADDGRVVVSLADESKVEVFEPALDTGFPLQHRCAVETPADPIGMAMTRDGKSLLVATRWEPTLSVYDAADMKKKHSFDLPRDPTSVLASADGKRAFVTHAAGGVVSVVDLENTSDKPESSPITKTALMTTQITHRPMGMPMGPPPSTKLPSKKRHIPTVQHERIGSQAFVLARSEKGIMAPLVMVEPKPPRGSSSGYGSAEASSPAIVGEIATIDEKNGTVQLKQMPVSIGVKDCFLPRAAAMDEAHDELFVSCLGIDEIIVYDASKNHPHDYEKRRIRVPAGPTGLAIDNDERRAVVFSTFAGEMTFVTLESPTAKTEKIDSKKSKRVTKHKKEAFHADVVSVVLPRTHGLVAEIALGRALFHASGRRNIAVDGRVCASCHPDGRDDGLTWQTQEGPRQTPMLVGRLTDDTAPFGWLGDKKTLPSHFKRTIERLAGMGIKDSERDAIFAYVKSLSPPKTHQTADDTRVARGKTIFESHESGCSSCHLGDATTDGARHDVASAGDFEMDDKFETPSLRFIGKSAPYFHDGRYATLIDMVEKCDGKMGTTKHLGDTDKASLVAYLETL